MLHKFRKFFIFYRKIDFKLSYTKPSLKKQHRNISAVMPLFVFYGKFFICLIRLLSTCLDSFRKPDCQAFPVTKSYLGIS